MAHAHPRILSSHTKLLHDPMWVSLEDVMISGRSQAQKMQICTSIYVNHQGKEKLKIHHWFLQFGRVTESEDKSMPVVSLWGCKCSNWTTGSSHNFYNLLKPSIDLLQRYKACVCDWYFNEAIKYASAENADDEDKHNVRLLIIDNSVT